MTSPFPTLLRRSSFATYDPLITRIYTSPSSSSGDWGLKYSTPLPKGPRYLKVANLDAGKAVRTDYTSGESEARWVQSWGSGKVRWNRGGFFPGNVGSFGREDYGKDILRGSSASSATDRSDAEGSRRNEREEMWMDDIESMTPQEFEVYLERVRASREAWRKSKLDRLSSSAKSRLSSSEDQTLGYLNLAGHASPVDGASLQTSLAHDTLSSPSSMRLLSRPHRLAGLAYSNGPASSLSSDRKTAPRYTHPVYTFPGRALDKTTAEQKVYSGRARMGGMTGWPMIVSAGGQLGVSTQSTRIADKTRQQITPVDYTRANPSAGEARWTVSKATLEKPPMVVGLKDSDAVGRWWSRDPYARRISAAARPRPMDTMNLRVEFDLAPDAEGPMANAGRGEWVAQGAPSNPLSEEESFGSQDVSGVSRIMDALGSKRSSRSPSLDRWRARKEGQATRAVRAETNAGQREALGALLRRIGEAGGGGDNGTKTQGEVVGGPRNRRGGQRGGSPAGTPTGTPRI